MASMPPARAAAVLSNGLSPISSSMTSLPDAFSERAIASTVKAVSTDSERAKLLRRADTVHLYGRAVDGARPRAFTFLESETFARAPRARSIAPCVDGIDRGKGVVLMPLARPEA